MSGGVAERPNAPVLKTGDTKVSVGSNPTPSAKLTLLKKITKKFDINLKCDIIFFVWIAIKQQNR